MSVTLAPRARISVKASWPGVSRKVTFDLSAKVHLIGADVLRDAAGFAATDVRAADRVEQRRLAVVDVAHDRDDRRARLQRLLAHRHRSVVSMSTSDSLTRLMRWPNSSISSSAVSWSMVSVIVTGVPILNSALTRSAPRSPMRLASSWTVIASGTSTSRTCFCGRAGLLVVPLFLLAGAAERGE